MGCQSSNVHFASRFTTSVSGIIPFVSNVVIIILALIFIASIDGFKNIVKVDGVQGLFRGTSLALVGVSNGALQFMAYEKMKKWGFDMKRQQSLREGRDWNPQVDKLVRCRLDISFEIHICFLPVKHILHSNVCIQ